MCTELDMSAASSKGIGKEPRACTMEVTFGTFTYMSYMSRWAPVC